MRRKRLQLTDIQKNMILYIIEMIVLLHEPPYDNKVYSIKVWIKVEKEHIYIRIYSKINMPESNLNKYSLRIPRKLWRILVCVDKIWT